MFDTNVPSLRIFVDRIVDNVDKSRYEGKRWWG